MFLLVIHSGSVSARACWLSTWLAILISHISYAVVLFDAAIVFVLDIVLALIMSSCNYLAPHFPQETAGATGEGRVCESVCMCEHNPKQTGYSAGLK